MLLSGAAPTELTWQDQGPNLAYDLAAGLLSQLVPQSGVAGATCLQDDLPLPAATDTRDAPAPGDGYYYLARSQNACSTGTYGTQSSGSERQPLEDCP